MTIAIILMGGLGLVVGIGLALASKVFYVYVDPKIVSVEEALPGANCGGCGLPGCSANAEAIVAGRAAPNSCVAAGEDVALAIAAILGVSVEAKEPDIALPGCTYGVADADVKYSYDGMNDCRAVALLSGGMKVCNIGCLGLGTCAAACPFDAIVMGPQGLPVVDEVKCTGCGTCERICPKHIITLSSVTRRILKEYTTEDCTTPCQRACPAGINISRYIQQIAEGDYHGSVQTIKERNPFPTVIGRICPRPCENDCRRKYVDEPVAINFLKRFAADYERTQKERIQPFKAPDSGRRIAVVGGGVQGLSAAFFAARLGHGATVFEGTDRLGGLLNTAIAKCRLPEYDPQMGYRRYPGDGRGRPNRSDAGPRRDRGRSSGRRLRSGVSRLGRLGQPTGPGCRENGGSAAARRMPAAGPAAFRQKGTWNGILRKAHGDCRRRRVGRRSPGPSPVPGRRDRYVYFPGQPRQSHRFGADRSRRQRTSYEPASPACSVKGSHFPGLKC